MDGGDRQIGGPRKRGKCDIWATSDKVESKRRR